MRRLLRLTLVLGAALHDARTARKSGALLPEQRLALLQRWCRAVLAALDAQVESNAIATRGLFVSNHLSYLDILVYASQFPCAFVSKSEVERWPIVGRLARSAGTIFINRQERGDAARCSHGMADYLREGASVVLFPEGTTSNGREVLRFYSSLLQPAFEAGSLIVPCSIRYELPEGDPATEVCWWGDMLLTPHLWNLLGKSYVTAKLHFGDPIPATGERRALASDLRERVIELRSVQAT